MITFHDRLTGAPFFLHPNDIRTIESRAGVMIVFYTLPIQVPAEKVQVAPGKFALKPAHMEVFLEAREVVETAHDIKNNFQMFHSFGAAINCKAEARAQGIQDAQMPVESSASHGKAK